MSLPRRSPAARAQDRAWQHQVAEWRASGLPPFDEQWARYQVLFDGRAEADGPPLAWSPSRAIQNSSNLHGLIKQLGLKHYDDLHAYSRSQPGPFFEVVLRRLGLPLAVEPDAFFEGATHPDACRWLPGARLNIALACVQGDGQRPALILGGEGQSVPRIVRVHELDGRSAAFARGLLGAGLEPGSTVALFLPMGEEAVAAYLGTLRAGLRVVSVAESIPAPELKARLDRCGAHLLVTAERFVRGGRSHDLLGRVRQVWDGPTVVVAGDGEGRSLRRGEVAFEAFLVEGGPLDPFWGGPDQVIHLLFSSGTTGRPKVIPWTQLTPIKCAMDGHVHQDLHPGDRIAWPTSLGWMMGPWLLFAALLNRATAALYEGSPADPGFGRFVQEAGVTHLGVVPSLVRSWRQSGAVDGADWSGVRLFSSTGEPSTVQDYLWLMSRAGYQAPIIEYCGGTEIGGGYITGTVLRPASPATFTAKALGLDFVLMDEQGRPVLGHGSGEAFLCPPSPGLSQRLLDQDHHQVYTEGCPAGPRGEVLRRHGDRVCRLPQGFYRSMGRADDAMNLGGIKVASAEIEAVVAGHEGLIECAAVAEQEGGEGVDRLVLFLVLAGPCPDLDRLRAALEHRIASRLNPLFHVHRLEILDALPRTPSGKLMRRELRRIHLHSDGAP